MKVFHVMPLNNPFASPLLPGNAIMASHLSVLLKVTILSALSVVPDPVALGVPGFVKGAPKLNSEFPVTGWPARLTMPHVNCVVLATVSGAINLLRIESEASGDGESVLLRAACVGVSVQRAHTSQVMHLLLGSVDRHIHTAQSMRSV